LELAWHHWFSSAAACLQRRAPSGPGPSLYV
jgi:hypothetical protein